MGGPRNPASGWTRLLVYSVLVCILNVHLFSFPIFALKPNTNGAGDGRFTKVVTIPPAVAVCEAGVLLL